MIFDNIKNADSYKAITPIYTALQYLKTVSESVYPSDEVELEGDNIFANPVSLTSKPVEDCIFEAHKKFIDIHYIVKGVEGISVCNIDELTPATMFDNDRDIGFYTGNEKGTLFLNPGEFMICWPQDAHRVAMMYDEPTEVTKIIVKVKIKELELYD